MTSSETPGGDTPRPEASAAPAPLPDAGRPPSPDARRIAPKSPRSRLEPETVPAPKAASRRARHPFIVAGNAIFSFLFILVIGAGVLLAIGRERFTLPGPLDRDRVVLIPRNSGIQDIADRLVDNGVIDNKWLFMAGVLALKAREELKAGEYVFPRGASMRDVVDTLVEGKVVQHTVTIAEGLTSEQIVQKLRDTDFLVGSIREIPAEGTLLPETYKFPRGTTREEVIRRMQQEKQRLVAQVWARRTSELPLRTPEQLVTLASIVEKETGRADERSRVAAVFINRLNRNMRLESDPTIIYGLVGGRGSLGRPILASEIRQPTPYNTYVINGLPPGPIANPGRASLEAVVNPSRTRDLFFVADGTGGHAFAETYEQHLRNVARWREIERAARAAGQAPPPGGGVGLSAPAPASAPASPAANAPATPRTTTLGAGAPAGQPQGQRPAQPGAAPITPTILPSGQPPRAAINNPPAATGTTAPRP